MGGVPMIKYTTLWDIMKEIHPEVFLKLGAISGVIDGTTKDNSNIIISERMKKRINGYFQSIQKHCYALGLTLSAISTERIIDISSQNPTYGKINELMKELTGRITDEMQSRIFLSIEPNTQNYFTNNNLFGNEVAGNFPSTEIDIIDAGKCLALNQWTASVFHSMRILEIGLGVLARELGVPFDSVNWQIVINNIEAEIKKISKATYGDDWKTKEQFYSEAALQFRYFKNAWRNHVMHVRDTYDEQRAETIFEHVKEFMVHLATKLKENTV